MHALVASLLCGLVRSELPPFAYGIFSLSLSAALVAIPLLGELGFLLRQDEAAEWVEAQPVRPLDLRLARTLHLLLLLAALSAASLVPAAALMDAGAGARAALLLGGACQTLGLAAGLLTVQALLGGRAEPALVLFQTLLVVAVVAGTVLGLRLVPRLAPLEAWSGAPLLWPPAWFAAPLARGAGVAAALPAALGALAATLLVLVPAPPARRGSAGGSLLGRLLTPARALAERLWVRPDERGSFALVYDGAPTEREFVLRTYPMVGIPLAFLLAAATGDDPQKREGFLALLLFSSGIYLPVLLSQLPASTSWAARWILDVAPVTPGAVAGGAYKALAVRFLLPLYAVLGALAWQEGGADLVLRWALPGALTALLVMRSTYRAYVSAPPLSTPPDEVTAEFQGGGPLMGWAMATTLLAAFAWKAVDTPARGLALAAALLLAEAATARAWRRRFDDAPAADQPSR